MEISAGEKRPGDAEGGLEVREVKRLKGGCEGGGGGVVVEESVRKVAEMVLVLAAMGKMRGGKVPSEVERELMVEAREKLAEVCEVYAPKDLFPREEFGGVIEDLGLNKLKEPRLGFCPPKISITEKLMLSKRKFQMEKSQDFTVPPAKSSQRLQGSSVTAVESRATSHPIRAAPSDKPSHMPARVQPPSVLGRAAAANSSSLPYQLPTSEVKPTVPNALPSGHPVTLPRIDRPHFRVEGRQNGSSHPSQVLAHSSGNHTTATNLSWSVQPQSFSSTQMGPDNKVYVHAIKVEGASEIKSGIPQQSATSKPVVTQIATGNPSIIRQNIQGMNFAQAPVRNTHAEIGKIVQKFLQPRHRGHPAWTPPSRDYMNKPLTCQMCQSTITEVDNVSVCDNCEKGFHLQCLQTANKNGAVNPEWHCLRCLSLSNGKPIPPKYGRVMRNTSTGNMSSNTAPVHPSPERKPEIVVDRKVNQQNVTPNGNIPMQNASTGSAGNTSSQLIQESKLPNSVGMLGNGIMSSRAKMDDKVSSGKHSNSTSSTVHVMSSANSCFDKLNEENKLAGLKQTSLVKSETAQSNSDHLQAPDKLQSENHVGLPSIVEMPSKLSIGNHLVVNDSVKNCDGQTYRSNSNNKLRNEQGVARCNPAEMATTTSGNAELANSSADHCYIVDWVGDIFQVVDEKTYYQACCINGVVYKVQDHVLVRFEDGRLIPSKLKAMWEDCRTRIKWVTVNRFYFPSDLPKAVGRPCGLESNEVYGSTCGSMIMAGLMQGLCEVLPPNKYEVEKERRARVGTAPDDDLRPCYLCKWIYDEGKGLFRDVSC